MEEDLDRLGVRIMRRGLGFAAQGPGFYVWDSEPRAVIESAQALSCSSYPSRPGPRVSDARRRLRRAKHR